SSPKPKRGIELTGGVVKQRVQASGGVETTGGVFEKHVEAQCCVIRPGGGCTQSAESDSGVVRSNGKIKCRDAIRGGVGARGVAAQGAESGGRILAAGRVTEERTHSFGGVETTRSVFEKSGASRCSVLNAAGVVCERFASDCGIVEPNSVH